MAPPLDLSHPALELQLLPTQAHILRLPPSTPLPPALLADPTNAGSFLTISRTSVELSVLYDSPAAGALLKEVVDGLEGKEGVEGPEGPWRNLKIKGPFTFGWKGVMARISTDLAEGDVSILAVSTFDTDYVLVKEEALEKALAVLRQAGWTVEA